MVIIGNILLGIAGLGSLVFFVSLLGKSSPGGDAAMGHALAIFSLTITVSVCLVAVVAIIGWRGGWSWVGTPGGGRFLLVTAGLFLAVGGAALGAFRDGLSPLTSIAAYLPALIWPLLLVGLGILLNGGASYHWPLLLAAGLGAVPCGLILFKSVKKKVEISVARANTKGQPNSNDLRMLDNIAAFDSSTHISNLLIFTDIYKHDTVRQAALARLRTYPDWQKQLADGLKTRWTSEVFTFLASADPDDPNLFAEPIRDGIFLQAADIRKQLSEADERRNFWAGEFSWEIERIHRTLVKFEKSGVDYKPAVQELRNALDTSCKAKKPDFRGINELLDKWLKTH